MFETIQDVINAGIWPASKVTTSVKGVPKLEVLGYKLFYIGKNADLYFIPGIVPAAIEYRSDRVSVFNIETDLLILGKGIKQTAISRKGYDFAEKLGIETARLPLPDNIPEEVAKRCSAMELCRPFEIQLPNGEYSGLEMIKRKFLTGSLFKKYYRLDKDPYNLNLPLGLAEWTEFEDMIFTPTEKSATDDPIDHVWVQQQCPEVVQLTDLDRKSVV